MSTYTRRCSKPSPPPGPDPTSPARQRAWRAGSTSRRAGSTAARPPRPTACAARRARAYPGSSFGRGQGREERRTKLDHSTVVQARLQGSRPDRVELTDGERRGRQLFMNRVCSRNSEACVMIWCRHGDGARRLSEGWLSLVGASCFAESAWARLASRSRDLRAARPDPLDVLRYGVIARSVRSDTRGCRLLSVSLPSLRYWPAQHPCWMTLRRRRRQPLFSSKSNLERRRTSSNAAKLCFDGLGLDGSRHPVDTLGPKFSSNSVASSFGVMMTPASPPSL